MELCDGNLEKWIQERNRKIGSYSLLQPHLEEAFRIFRSIVQGVTLSGMT